MQLGWFLLGFQLEKLIFYNILGDRVQPWKPHADF